MDARTVWYNNNSSKGSECQWFLWVPSLQWRTDHVAGRSRASSAGLIIEMVAVGTGEYTVHSPHSRWNERNKRLLCRQLWVMALSRVIEGFKRTQCVLSQATSAGPRLSSQDSLHRFCEQFNSYLLEFYQYCVVRIHPLGFESWVQVVEVDCFTDHVSGASSSIGWCDS